VVPLGIRLKVVCGAAEYTADLRVIRLGGKAPAFFLDFSKGF
jgi:hypothetical protein